MGMIKMSANTLDENEVAMFNEQAGVDNTERLNYILIISTFIYPYSYTACIVLFMYMYCVTMCTKVYEHIIIACTILRCSYTAVM